MQSDNDLSKGFPFNEYNMLYLHEQYLLYLLHPEALLNKFFLAGSERLDRKKTFIGDSYIS